VKTLNVLLGYLGPYNTFNEESALSRKAGRKTSPITAISVGEVIVTSHVSYGEWLNLNLKYSPSKFVLLKNEDLVRQYNIGLYKKKFRKFQKRLVTDLLKETAHISSN
jgi:hypothetical protein